MRAARWPLLAVLAAAAFWLGAGCAAPRVHRLTDFEYMPKAADAPIDLFVGKLTRPYVPIAVVDSHSAALEEWDRDPENRTELARAANAEMKKRMIADLEAEARRLGGDAVHDVRMLSTRTRGMVADEQVPLPGAVRQGVYRRHFLRGEVVRYVEEMGAAPSLLSRQPAAETDD